MRKKGEAENKGEDEKEGKKRERKKARRVKAGENREHKREWKKKFCGICLAKEFHKSKKEFCLKNIQKSIDFPRRLCYNNSVREKKKESFQHDL